MFDLGRTFLAAVERSPEAIAIADAERRLSYAAWHAEIARVAGGLIALGLKRGDRLAVILPNRLEMASVHWACQFAGVVATPLNWRIKTEELEYCLTDALVDELRGFPPLAQRTAKKLLNDIEDATLSLGIELEGQAYGRLRSSDDFREGVAAFHRKRRPNFTGR